jgi:hypothetical protein
VFNDDSQPCPGIDIQVERQIDRLKTLSKHFRDFPFPPLPDSEFRYHYQNSMYGLGDGLLLYAFLRHYRPQQLIEIGSGFSSALMLDTVDRHPETQTRFTFIEPLPRRLQRLLRPQDTERCRIIRKNVQKVDLSFFKALNENDILFIDSSHVVKIGSDVSHILFEILPSLKRGVLVHFHDIWWPFEYPREMIMEGRIWNEPYFLRSFLQFNHTFEIIYFASYLEKVHREVFLEQTPDHLCGASGKSLWLRKKG